MLWKIVVPKARIWDCSNEMWAVCLTFSVEKCQDKWSLKTTKGSISYQLLKNELWDLNSCNYPDLKRKHLAGGAKPCVSTKAPGGQCGQSDWPATIPILPHRLTKPNISWFLHIEFHISDPEMCTGLCVQLQKYMIWKFCWLEREKGRKVQILYALDKSEVFLSIRMMVQTRRCSRCEKKATQPQLLSLESFQTDYLPRFPSSGSFHRLACTKNTILTPANHLNRDNVRQLRDGRHLLTS